MLLQEQMIVLFILMGVGFLCYKLQIITDEVNKKLSAIVVNIANPAMVLTGCMGDDKIKGEELLMVFVLVIIVYTVLVLLAMVIPPLLKIDKKSRGTYQAMTIFSNIGFMGFPVVAALYGNSAVLYASLFSIPYNMYYHHHCISAADSRSPIYKEHYNLSEQSDSTPKHDGNRCISCNYGYQKAVYGRKASYILGTKASGHSCFGSAIDQTVH